MEEQMVFEGFEPSPKLRSLAKELLWYLEGKSPSQASSLARLVKQAEIFKGDLQIAFGSGQFHAEASDKNPEQVMQLLYKSALAQIKIWAASRTEPV